LLIALFFAGTLPCISDSVPYRDSIAILLKSSKHDISTLNQLNYLVAKSWEKTPGHDEIINDAHAVLNTARSNGNDVVIADALINLVKMYLLKYESSKSLQYALEAYSKYEKAGLHDKMAYALLQMGVIYYTQNNFTKSLEYYNNAVNEYAISGNKQYISTLFYLSGINYSRLNNFSSAHLFFNRALDLKNELNDEQGLAECHLGLAELFISQQQPDSAMKYLAKTTEYTTKINSTYGTAKASILEAEAWFQKSDFRKAEASAMEGIRIAKIAKARELIIDGRKILYRINAKANNFKDAYMNLESYMSLRDSVINEKTSKSIARLEADYILEKKQDEIKILENQKKNRTILLYASLIIGILAILLSVVFYNKQQIKQRANQQLETAYKELETTQNQLINQEKLASLGQLTAGIAHEIKNPLNFVNNFSQISIDLLTELGDLKNDSEREEVIQDIKLNLEKIAKHGERANSIITRMLDHSRSGERELHSTDINKLIHEYYTLAYQATRINNPGFFCIVIMKLDENIPQIKLVTQEISRVLLNIFNNSLYALSQKKAGDADFKPEVRISSKLEGHFAVITIGDNGNGIPAEILNKIFQPFFTTKPTGEGTGLGLSLSYDIIKAHGGVLSASNNSTGGAEFVFTLPVQNLTSTI